MSGRITRLRRALADIIDVPSSPDMVLVEVPRGYQPIIRKMVWSAQSADTGPAATAAQSEVTVAEYRSALLLAMSSHLPPEVDR